MTQAHEGRCLCGAVTVRVDADLSPVTFCHCSQCRRQTGLYYAATSVPLDKVTLTGEGAIGRFRASKDAERGFCKLCGSALYWQRNGEAVISLMAGLFDAPSGLAGGKHIFVADKAAFYDIDDALPRHGAGG
ncbi:GFA family protein [Peteryoungia ipomoeae]|uniref:GFA family protein n=1 Tax=Peteryoungia ipomoeae TaxID=1210932 RepID=A0A4S8P4F7_9HYPH|nr:GFA family protein [Peteryoungia ipomoeae]THV24950.1 GFA family protein [Peteryoungia ipomoeae]